MKFILSVIPSVMNYLQHSLKHPIGSGMWKIQRLLIIKINLPSLRRPLKHGPNDMKKLANARKTLKFYRLVCLMKAVNSFFFFK